MSLNIVQTFFFRMFATIMMVIYSITPAVPPSTDNVIEATNPKDVKMVFATVADPQVSNYMFGRYRSFQAGCEDLKNAACKIDAIVGIGDIAENGLAEEYRLVHTSLSGIDTRYIMATGNHDIRLRLYQQSVSRFTEFTDALNGEGSIADLAYADGKLAYSEVVNGYKFIVMGSDKTEFEEAYISSEQLEWLDNELAAEKGKPVFVLLHQPLKETHNIDVAWNSSVEGAGSVGDQSDEIQAILAKHAADSTVVLITGHLHAGFSEYSYQKIDGFHSFNVPSMSIENKDGAVNGSGLTYIVEVYDDEILFRARNVEIGEWLPDWDVTIPVK